MFLSWDSSYVQRYTTEGLLLVTERERGSLLLNRIWLESEDNPRGFFGKEMACTSKTLVVRGDLKHLDLLGKIMTWGRIGKTTQKYYLKKKKD